MATDSDRARGVVGDGSPTERRQLLPALGRLHELVIEDAEACEALEEVMLLAGYLSEEASNPMGAAWNGDAPEWTI